MKVIILSIAGDTVESYFLKWNSKLIMFYEKGYNKIRKLEAKEAKGFTVKRGKKTESYNQIEYTVKVGFFDSKRTITQFCKPEIEGKIVLYKTEFSVSSSGYMNANGVMTGGGSQIYPVYVFVVDGETYTLRYQPLESKEKVLRDLEAVFSDYSELYNRISKTGITKRDIPGLVREYNEHFKSE